MSFGKKYKENIDEHGTQSLWLKFADGESHRVVLAGEEEIGYAEFVDGSGYAPSSKEENGRLRFAVNVFDGKGIKVLDGPEGLYRKLGELSQDVDVDGFLIKITKVSNKQWEVSGLRSLKDEEAVKFAKCKPHDLRAVVGWLKDAPALTTTAPAAAEPEATTVDDDELPF